MGQLSTVMKVKVDIVTRCSVEVWGGVEHEFWKAELYILGHRVARSDANDSFASEAAAIRSAKQRFKLDLDE